MNVYELTQQQLTNIGIDTADRFMEKNEIVPPTYRVGPLVTSRAPQGSYGCGAHYPQRGGLIWVNPEACAKPARGNPRQRSFPGYTSDRTPIGVVAHEAGHHIDWKTGNASREAEWRKLWKREAVTSYEPAPWEAFAESVRLYILNPALLKAIAPNRYAYLGERFYTIVPSDVDPTHALARYGATDYMLQAAAKKARLC